MRVSQEDVSPARLRERVDSMAPLRAVRDAAGDAVPHLVGGAVRDLALGLERIDLDVAVEAPPDDVAALARRIDPDAVVHDRFGTASVTTADAKVDLAATRTETYERPGALPTVSAAGIDADLARRDFTVNAMAIPLQGDARLLDPHGGLADLGDGILRALHDSSFVDDPTRALRAARYASRLELEPEPATAALLPDADLGVVSAERVEAELRRAAGEPDPTAVLALLLQWGLVDADVDLAGAALAVLDEAGWDGVADRAAVLLAAGSVRAGRFRPGRGSEGGRALADVQSSRPSELVSAARGHDGVELVIARALGADWLDRYVREWRDVRLQITGADLLDAGVEEGPGVGRGLMAALAAKLDGEVTGPEEELATALKAAREAE